MTWPQALERKPQGTRLTVRGLAPGEVPSFHVTYETEADRDEALRLALEAGEHAEAGPDNTVVWR